MSILANKLNYSPNTLHKPKNKAVQKPLGWKNPPYCTSKVFEGVPAEAATEEYLLLSFYDLMKN
jgi:hypothetical protein